MIELLSQRHIRFFCLTVVLLAFVSGALRTAIPLLTTQAGYSVSGMSWAQGLFALAWPMFGIFAGTLIDRHHKVRIAIRAALLFAILHLAIAGLFVAGLPPPEYVFVYAVLAGIVVVSAEAYMMTIPPLIMEGERLAAFYSIVLFLDFGFSYFIGPVIASAIVTDYPLVFFTLIIGILFATIPTVRQAIPELAPSSAATISFGYVMVGFQFIFSNRNLICLTVLTFFLSVVFGAFLTSFVFFVTNKDYLGLDPSYYGLMFSAYAIGAMTGALAVRHLLGAASVRTAIIADGLGTVALLVVPAFSANVVAVWLTTFVAGVGLSLWFVAVTTFRQQLTPQDILGRANSASSAMPACRSAVLWWESWGLLFR